MEARALFAGGLDGGRLVARGVFVKPPIGLLISGGFAQTLRGGNQKLRFRAVGGAAHRDARRGEAESQPASLRQGDKPCKLAVQFREVESHWSFRNGQKMRLRHSCGCLSLTLSRSAHPEAPCICALRVTAQTNVNLIYVIIVMYAKLNIVKNRVYVKLINVKTSSMTLQIGI